MQFSRRKTSARIGSRRSGRIAIGAATFCAVMLAGVLHPADAHRNDGARLREAPRCSPQRHQASSPRATGDATTIRVTVPATTVLRLDAHRHVEAVMTNSGCAPRATDAIYLWRPDGSFTRTTAQALRGHSWTGDFRQPGVYVIQR